MSNQKKQAAIVGTIALIVVLLVMAREILSVNLPAIYYHQNFEFVPHETRAECSLGITGIANADLLVGGLIENYPYAGVPSAIEIPDREGAFVLLSRDRCEDLSAMVWDVLRNQNSSAGTGFFELTAEDWAALPIDIGPPVWRDHPNFDARYWALWPMMRTGDAEALIAYYASDLSHKYQDQVDRLPLSPIPAPSIAYANLKQANEALPEEDDRRTVISDRLETLYKLLDEGDRAFFDQEWDSGVAKLSRMIERLRFGLIRPDRGPTKISPEVRQAARLLFLP